MLEAVCDTSFLVAAIVEDDVHHERALRDWASLAKAYVPLITLTELAYFLIKHRLDLKVLEEVVSDPKVEVVENTLGDVLFAVRNRRRVMRYDDFNDLLVLAVALRLDFPLLTYDEEQAKLAEKMHRRTI